MSFYTKKGHHECTTHGPDPSLPFTANVLDSLIVVTDVSDHLPILINLDLAPSWIHGTNSSLVRNINDSSMKVFKSLIEQIDWSSTFQLCDLDNTEAAYNSFVNDIKSAYNIDWSSTFQLCDLDNTEAAYNSFVNDIKSAYNIAFPLLPPRPKHMRLSYKHPWMTQGLLKSCKIKSKLYLKFLKNPTEANKQKFIVYRNKFKALRIRSEKDFYASEFQKHSKDLKKTWQVIKSILNPSDVNTSIEEIYINGEKVEGDDVMANKFNEYFTNIAQSLSSNIPPASKSFLDQG